jgi:hypothetical protein
MKKRELNKGMKILFFGTEYSINKVVEFDIVEVVLGNGIKINLWFPNLPGRDIIEKYTRSGCGLA